MLNEELWQYDLIRPQRVVAILPVKHQVILAIRVYSEKQLETKGLRSADIIYLSFMCYFMIKERDVFIIVCIYWMCLTALQLQRAVLRVQREAAEVHRAESRHSDPETPTHTDIKQLPLQLSLHSR